MSARSKPPRVLVVVDVARRRADEDERPEPGPIPGLGEDADGRRHGVPDIDHVAEVEGFEDLEDVVGVAVQRVVLDGIVGREVGAARTHQVEEHHAMVVLEPRCHRSPHLLAAAEAMHEHDGAAGGIPRDR